MNSKIESWIHGSCRFVIHLRLHSFMMSYTSEVVMKFLPAQSSWIWCKSVSSKLFCPFKNIFNLTEYREVIVTSICLPKMFPLFYKECLNDWANYKAKSIPPTLCAGDALNEIFWNNKVICVAGKPLFKKNWVKKAIIKLKLML